MTLMESNDVDTPLRRNDKFRFIQKCRMLFIKFMTDGWRSGMRKSTMTLVTRAYFFLGAVLVAVFSLTVGPYLAEQTINIWMAFGAGLALIAYGRTNVRRQWISNVAIILGTIWICALIFTIFGVADL